MAVSKLARGKWEQRCLGLCKKGLCVGLCVWFWSRCIPFVNSETTPDGAKIQKDQLLRRNSLQMFNSVHFIVFFHSYVNVNNLREFLFFFLLNLRRQFLRRFIYLKILRKGHNFNKSFKVRTVYSV